MGAYERVSPPAARHARGTLMLEIHGRIVPMAREDPEETFLGRVRIGDSGLIEWVKQQRWPPRDDVTVVDVGESYVYPGLIDLHSHIAFAPLPLWDEPTRPNPFLHHDTWPNARSYRSGISWPAYALAKGAPEALMAYAQIRALAGGTTAIQGWPPANRNPANRLVRNIDDEDFGSGLRNMFRTSALTLDQPELTDRARHMAERQGLIYHCAEGQKGSKVVKEFADVARTGCLRGLLIAIHCSAVGDEAFRQWAEHADLAGDPEPGGVVWSPFSNLWLYGETTDVDSARRYGLTVALGSDWAPSGTKNLLGELKVADLWARHAGLDLTHFDLARMVTAAPGDLLARCWPHRAGRLEEGNLADVTVLAARHPDPWLNLVYAQERDVELVVIDGRARYGTLDLMRDCGESSTASIPIGRYRRRAVLRHPDDPDRTWTWQAVLDAFAAVRADPAAAIAAAQARATRDLLAGPTAPRPELVLELDMPGGPQAMAGPPPPGADYEIPETPTLVHDRAWHRSIAGRAYHGGLLDGLADY